ncbi:MAG: CPBP family intramembrane metalloprotease [Clostridia bacterium]|nr:CPBP family intramembrane metalloprotease [Clostridia bacterium]
MTIGILPAVFEELLFRKCILRSLQKHDELLAVLISALIFGMLHSGITGMSFAFLSGVVLGFVRIYTGRFLAAIAVHLLNNLLALVTAAVGVFISPEMKSIVFYFFGIVGIVFTVIGFIMLKARNIKLYRAREGGRHLTQTIKECPALWAYFLLAVVMKIF